MVNTNKPAQKQLIFNYLKTPEETRLALPKFLKLHKMQRRTFYIFEGEYRAEVKNLSVKEKNEKLEKTKNIILDAWDRVEGKEPPKRLPNGGIPVSISDDEKVALARKVYQDAMLKGATAKDKDLAVRMLGMLIEKSESKVTHELSADERTRRNLEAERQLRGTTGYRVEEMPEERPLLSQ